MKFEKRHLQIALVILLAIVAYNVWSFTRSTRSAIPQQNQAPLLANVQPVARPDVTTQQPIVDPASIPAPPSIDLKREPTWAKDPFLGAGESRRFPTAAPAREVAGPEPTVRSILYSPGRRLAIVDNRIVQIGDRVAGGEISDIEREAIVIKTASGEKRRIALFRGPTLQERSR